MILQSLGIEYEILEANNRIGGRLFTHRFNGQQGVDAPVGTPARYDYFDVGAMRFPDMPFMKRLWDLFDILKIKDLFVDYNLSAANNLKYFNTVNPPYNATNSADQAAPGDPDYFRVSVANGGTVPDDFAAKSVDHWTGQVYDYYKTAFAKLDDPNLSDEQRRKIFRAAWADLVDQDHHTTRSAMRQGLNGVRPYPNPVVEWLETFDSATGLYDRAFVESVMDSLDFDWPYPSTRDPPQPIVKSFDSQKETKWYCIDGGSDHIAREMAKKLHAQPILSKKVTKIAESGRGITVVVAGEATPRKYTQVISTVPLGCLSGIDIEDCDLLYSQKQAVRSLRYDASTKVGIKFETRWWQDPEIMGAATIKGGQSSTDIPIRTCVYPSYGINCPDAPGVLLASYTWSQDALRIGALASGTQAEKDELLRLTLENLSKLHGLPVEKFGPVIDFYAHSFYADQYSRGAFALFGPGQFGHPHDRYSLFASIKAPAAHGKFHVAGEATSVHHAWVLGALNSAWRAVYNALDGYPEKRKDLIRMWGIPDEENQVHLNMLRDLALQKWL
ncbi:hypothetical protein HYPSUDRAFT_146222 [Hypholoma sublateritium FD-334 SS-4]|uniref:Amine oxidase domain-containing protein n=1 Tax=Hypholoma sublateritium (strain FD-334 SS-4) TaxID=945553 RepID=A0A0D2M3H0_HYPSF|nr:hypothetical protein HYPSUDRAFT_146222 [Hypholoma sublateritium FD-334 SS-4]